MEQSSNFSSNRMITVKMDLGEDNHVLVVIASLGVFIM